MSFNLAKAKPVAVPVDAPKKGVSRRLGLQGILSLGFLAAAGGIAATRYKEDLLDMLPELPSFTPDSKSDTPAAVMFVLDNSVKISREQGQANNSQLVRETCDKLGVEYRRYSHDADLFQEESWARVMQSIGREFGAPCLVIVDRKGRGKAMVIPTGVEAVVRLLEKTYGV